MSTNTIDIATTVPDAISVLKKLKRPIGNTGRHGLKARITFIVNTYFHMLTDSLIHYELYDVHKIGERDLDTCFEMHDGDDVIHGVIQASLSNKALEDALKLQLGKHFKHWKNVHETIEKQNTQQSLF